MGGAETSLTDLLAALRGGQPDWDLHLWLGESGPLEQAAKNLGVTTRIFPLPERLAGLGDSGLGQPSLAARALGWLHLMTAGMKSAWGSHRYGRRLKREISLTKPDIVHATGLKMQIFASLYAPESVRVLWHIHDYVGSRRVAGYLLRLLASRADGALANSESVAQDLRAACPGLAWVRRFYNAVDQTALTSGAPYDLDAAAGVPTAGASTLRIGLVATFARWKGQLTFLDALRQLAPLPEWRAYLVGGAIYKTKGSQFSREELQRAIEERNLQDRVFLTGFLNDRGGVMRGLDIVVHASDKPEPFGMVVIEAMACERPVVVSRAGGAVELFEEGHTALGHNPGNATELAKQIQRLLDDESLRKHLAQAGAAHVRKSFSREVLAQELVDAYGKLLSFAKNKT